MLIILFQKSIIISLPPQSLKRMIEPKNNNFYFEPVEHLKMFNTWTLQNGQVFQVFQVFLMFQVFNRFRMFQNTCVEHL